MRGDRSAVVSVMLVIIGLLSIGAGSPANAADLESSSYEIMSTLIRERFGTDFDIILIDSRTEPVSGGIAYVFFQKDWVDLKRETIDSLITLNSGHTRQLEAKFDLPVDYLLVSEQEYFAALQDSTVRMKTYEYSGSGHLVTGTEGEAAGCDTLQPDWDNFDRLYPDAQGLITFSRVAFDSERTQALLIFSNAYRCSGVRVRPQSRKTAFFRYRDGSWQLVGVSK